MRRSSSFWALVAGFAASVILLVAGGLTLLASLFGLTLRHRPDIVHEVIDGTPVTHA